MVAEENHIAYNDGIIKLFLYTKGTKGGSKELKNLLTYMEHTTAEKRDSRIELNTSTLCELAFRCKTALPEIR